MTKSKNNKNTVYIVKDRITQGICLMDGNRIIAENIKPESICFYHDSGLVAAMFDIPMGDTGLIMNPPVHFFMYSNNSRRTYLYKKDSVILSSVYKYPICRENNKIQVFLVEGGNARWKTIFEIHEDQRVFKNSDSHLCIESKVNSDAFILPKVISGDLKVRDVSFSELRRFLWKYIYYGLAEGKVYDFMLRDLVIPENDTIDSIKGLIKSIEDGKRKVRYKLENKDSSDFPSFHIKEADIDDMIKAIDKQIALLEEEERRERFNKEDIESDNKESSETKENKQEREIPLLEEIIKKGEDYQFCSDYKLEMLKDFVFIVEDELELSPEDILTYILIKLVNISRRIFPVDSHIAFPSDEFNNLLNRELSGLTQKEKEKLKKVLCAPITNNDYCDPLFLKEFCFDKLCNDEDKMKQDKNRKELCSTTTMLDNSVGNRIGWIGYDVTSETEYICYVEAVPFGDLNYHSEIHPRVETGSINLKKIDGFVYAEVYYDLNDGLFHVINPDCIPNEKIYKCMRDLEGREVDYVINRDYQKRLYIDSIEEDVMELYVDINNPEVPEEYIPRFIGVRYSGIAILDGNKLYIKRIRIDDDRSSIKRLLNEKQGVDIRGEKFNVNNIVDSGECIIISKCFNMPVISILVKCFGINNWNWKCSESE